jgi:hypothetical protein
MKASRPTNPPPSRPPAEPETPPPSIYRRLPADASIADEVKQGVELLKHRNPYFRLAWKNPYNLSLVLGALGASALTLNPLIALGALGLEAIWLLHGPDNPKLRRLLWDPRLENVRRMVESEERESRLKSVGDPERARVSALVDRQQEIRRLAAQNPSFTGDLLRDELTKTDRLVDAFVEMAVTCARYEAYLKSVDAVALDRDRRRYETGAHAEDPKSPGAVIAQKNLAIVTKRIDKLNEIEKYLAVAKGQLDLIENSFQLIADQIVTMQSPQQLSGQLDELLDGVEAIRETARDTEAVLGTSEPSSFP